MVWNGFDGRAYSRDEFAAHVASLRWTDWRPKGITLHNTAAPRLDQWAESGPTHDARIRNLQNYYQTQLGWHAGPHLFVSRNHINGFSDLTQPGVHSRCFNATHLGIEMVGDYNAEEFDSGDGFLVKSTTVFTLAVLFKAIGASPDGLVFHKECAIDNHDCPGGKVNKADIIKRVKDAMMGAMVDAIATAPVIDKTDARKRLQAALNDLGADPPLEVDGQIGPRTRAVLYWLSTKETDA